MLVVLVQVSLLSFFVFLERGIGIGGERKKSRLVIKRSNEALGTHDLIPKARVSIKICGICILSISYKWSIILLYKSNRHPHWKDFWTRPFRLMYLLFTANMHEFYKSVQVKWGVYILILKSKIYQSGLHKC